MIRKMIGLVCMSAFVASLAACGGSSSTNAQSDECTENPASPNCVQENPAPDPTEDPAAL